MLPDRVSNPGPLAYESGALPIALPGPATIWLTFVLYSNIFFQFYIELTGLREVQYVITSNFPT